MAAICTNMASKMAASGISNMATVDTKMATNMADINTNKMASKMAAKNGNLTFNHSLHLFWAENNEQTWQCHEVHQNVQKCTSNGYEHEKTSWILNYRKFYHTHLNCIFTAKNGAQQGTYDKSVILGYQGEGGGVMKKEQKIHHHAQMEQIQILSFLECTLVDFVVEKLIFWGKMWREDGNALNNLGTSKHN